MNTIELASRRKRLLDLMDDGSIALIYSGVEKVKSADENYPFEVNHNFYYLTGIEQDGCCLMLVSNSGERKEYLFLPPFDPVKEKWYGKRLSLEEAGIKSGIRNVLLSSNLKARVNTELSGAYNDFGSIDKVYLDLADEVKIDEGLDTKRFGKKLVSTYPGSSLFDINDLMAKLRLIKSNAEIACFRNAVESTYLGIKSMMALIRPGVKEYELSNAFFHTINDDNADSGLSFNTIVASGRSACTLHYPNPRGTLNSGELVLVDCGARNSYYCGDVSRTFPVDGKFTPEQRKIYEIVLGANKAVAQMARPGVSLYELQELCSNYLATECVAAGLLEKKEDIGTVYYHSVSHYIGIDCHDLGDRKAPLQAGNVISDEPGLYFEKLGIGVRIEDDLLITEDGCEVLTKDIMKEVADIEAALSRGKRN